MTATRPIVVGPGAAPIRRAVGAQAWSALEVLVAATEPTEPAVVVTSVRTLAEELGVAKNTAARALAALASAGLIEARQARSQSGEFGIGSYRLTIPDEIVAVAVPAPTARVTSNEAPHNPRTREANGGRRDDVPAQLSLLDAG